MMPETMETGLKRCTAGTLRQAWRIRETDSTQYRMGLVTVVFADSEWYNWLLEI